MTTLYNPLVNIDPLALNYLTYGQVPLPLSPLIPNFFSNATLNSEGTTLNTNGLVLSNSANTGYAGFTNYTVKIPQLPPVNLNSLTLEPVNPNLPVLNASQGFTLEFDLKLLQESSAAGRAGFSVLVVSNDPSKSIEIGFKEQGNSDRIFAQNATFGEGESSSVPLNLNQTQTFWVSFLGDQYSVAANGLEILTGSLRDYIFNPTSSSPPLPAGVNPYEAKNLVFFGDNTDQAYTQFTLGRIEVRSHQQSLTSALYDDYLASYGDLIQAFSYNLDAARQHFSTFGFKEGRAADAFAEAEYLASHGDLIKAFGYNLDAATRHYIEYGYAEGRKTSLFKPQLYLNAYSDLKAAFGNDTAAATRHYIEYGYAEGRDSLLGFDGAAYIASYQDLITAFGYSPQAGRQHYLEHGYAEGRTVSFQADEYLASYGDLIRAFGYNLAAATQHYITFGATEGRASDLFDANAYLNKYADLKTAFGSNLDAAAKHFVEYGFAEGRSWA